MAEHIPSLCKERHPDPGKPENSKKKKDQKNSNNTHYKQNVKS